MSNGKGFLADQQADLRAKRAAALRAQADGGGQELADRVAAETGEPEPEFHFAPGEVLPAGFVNPPLGDPGHKCLRIVLSDDKNKYIELYRPDWFQVFIHKTTSEQADRQFFVDDELGPIRVPTNRWVDVPPSVVKVLQDCRYEKTTIDENAAKKALLDTAPTTIEYIPRFSFQSIPSA